jgi:hypothetical protein
MGEHNKPEPNAMIRANEDNLGSIVSLMAQVQVQAPQLQQMVQNHPFQHHRTRERRSPAKGKVVTATGGVKELVC